MPWQRRLVDSSDPTPGCGCFVSVFMCTIGFLSRRAAIDDNRPRMRVALLNTFDTAGGAARAMHRLYVGLGRIGIQRTLYVARRDSNDAGIVPVRPATSDEQAEWQVLEAAIRAEEAPYPALGGAGFVPFHSERAARALLLERRLGPTDLFNLHWTRGLVDWSHFLAARRPDQPVVWTLHDQHVFTGGCHYAGDCTGFTQACGHCPLLASDQADDLSALVLARKRQALARLRPPMHVVTPSRWMAAAAARSSLLRDIPVHTIPNGLDTDVFRPVDRRSLRLRLGIDPDATVILFVAHILDDPRKGYLHLRAALDALPTPGRLVLVVAGESQVPPPAHVPFLHRGAARDDAELASLYAMADLVAVPSDQENYPNTALEALACGTPVIGFAIGGMPELVQSGETGLLAPSHDRAAFSETLAAALSDRARLAGWGWAGRAFVERECSLDRVAQRYAAVFEAAVGGPVLHGQAW